MRESHPPTPHGWQRLRVSRAALLGALLIVVALAAVACGTATPEIVPSATPPPPAPVSGTAETSPANMPPVIFVMLDWFNGDWGNPDYRFSYVDDDGYRHDFRGHPEYGALGGWTAFEWRDLNPGKDYYDWYKTDQYIKDAQSMSVTLPDGSVIAKPVGIAIETWAMEEMDEQIGINFTPGYVSTEMGTSSSSCYDPDGYSGPCKPFCTPKFGNSVWQYWFNQFILALGRHYDNNPEFHNLAFINIATGADEETNERKSFGDCAYDTGGNSKPFDDWVLDVIETYNLAFPTTPQFIQSTLHGIHYHAEHAASFPSKMSGVKVNGMELDVSSAEVRFDGVLVGGVTGYSSVWHEMIPTGFEPKHGNGIEGSYWYYMESLAVHPYIYDTQLPNIADTYESEQRTGFPIHDFVRKHLGKTVQNTPDVWILLRDTYGQDTTWTGSDGIVRTYGPHHGDYPYWLYRRDSAAGSRTVTLRAENMDRELPSAARNHVYGWHSARRTDQSTGNPYMSFDVDDRYPHTGELPKAAGGEVSWYITVTLVNKGTDSFSLEYKNLNGDIVERRVNKGAALGPVNNWVDHTWHVEDAYFDNGLPGAMDFRIDCNNDGDEIMHRVIVHGDGPPPPPPTPTPTLPPTRTPTKTTTPPTRTPTATRTQTQPPPATATNTIPPLPTATSGPSPTPTSTPTMFPGGQNEVTLQQGVAGYSGTTDSYMLLWSPAANFGNQANLRAKNDSVYSGLLRFDLSSVPAAATINQATLFLYAYNRDKTQAFELQLYGLLRPWTEQETTWDRAGLGDPWGAPGANDLTTDRDADLSARTTVSALNAWYELDVTELVQRWTASPHTNHGMLLRGLGGISVYYDFISAQHPQRQLHPRLVIDYTAAGASPTPTGQAAATATRTASGTPAPTATATATGAPSPTHTATRTQLPSATPSAPPTNTPTAFPGGQNTVTLQQGVGGYQGTSDTFICAWNPAGNFALQGNLIVKNDSVYSSLLRFDLTSIPQAATINQATLRLFAYNRNSQVGLDLEVYRVLRLWVAKESTWNRASDGTAWGVPGCNDTSADREADPLAVVPVSAVSAWYEADVTSLVHSWLANPASNQGVILRGFGTVSVMYDFGSSRHPTISLHPQLVIDYTSPVVPTDTPAAPTATQTASATASRTPTNTPPSSPTATATVTASPTASSTGTLPPTATSTPMPTSEYEPEIEQMERRVSTLAALVQSIIDIFRRAAGLGR